MLKVNPYLNFNGKAEEAFNFYKSVFGVELSAIHRMSDVPDAENLPEGDKNRIMHISLPLSDSVVLMASDCMSSGDEGFKVGNNNYISLHPDSREEADRLFKGLSEGGEVEMPMEDQFWGDYFGSFKDKFGVCWMINHNPEN